MIGRFDSDLDFNEYLNGPDMPEFNAECSDCGVPYSQGAHDSTTWCDTCSNQRDAHTDALEIRLGPAKAGLPIIRRTEVA